MSIIFSLEGMVSNESRKDLIWERSEQIAEGSIFKSEVKVCYNIDLPTSKSHHMLQIFIGQKILVKWQWFVKAQLLLVIGKDFGGEIWV